MLNSIESFAPVVTAIVAAFSATGLLIAALIQFPRFRRERESISIQERRLSEVNVSMTGSIEITPMHRPSSKDRDKNDPERAFLILRLTLENKGDGPVDILGALVSARVLTASHMGVALRGRDLGWKDYHKLYWNEHSDDATFIGISSTKHLMVASEEFPRMAVNENVIIHRIDATNHFHPKTTLYLMYRSFFVARGYSLGEVLRDVEGYKQPRKKRDGVQFKAVLRPNYARWSRLQKALFNINRLSFRLATTSKEHDRGDPDILGHLMNPNSWRLFLLFHWNFIDDMNAAPLLLGEQYYYSAAQLQTLKLQGNALIESPEAELAQAAKQLAALTTIDEDRAPDILATGRARREKPVEKLIDKEIRYSCSGESIQRYLLEQLTRHHLGLKSDVHKKIFEDGMLPQDWFSNYPQYEPIVKLCQVKLRHMLHYWRIFLTYIDALESYSRNDWESKSIKQISLRNFGMPMKENLYDPAKEAFPQFIKLFPELQARWLALMNEGYLITAPVPGNRPKRFTAKDIPDDPRELEPFVMQTRFFIYEVPDNSLKSVQPQPTP